MISFVPKTLAIVALSFCLLYPGPALAEKTMYVSDLLKVTVRTGPGTEHKIIAVGSSGDRVKVLEGETDGWARVRLDDGQEGWILGRYLMDEKPASLRLAELDPQTNNLGQKVQELEKENLSLKDQLQEARKSAKDVSGKFQELQSSSADFLTLRQEYQKLKTSFDTQRDEIKQLRAENESLRFTSNLKWFLAGGGVLFLGWLMGLALHRKRQRHSSLLS